MLVYASSLQVLSLCCAANAGCGDGSNDNVITNDHSTTDDARQGVALVNRHRRFSGG